MHLKVLDSRPDLTIVHSTGSLGGWATRGRSILRCTEMDGRWESFGHFPRLFPHDLMAIGRLPRRLLRFDKCNVWPTRDGRVLGIRGGQVMLFEADPLRPPIPLFEIEGDCVMNRAFAEDADGNIYFGEYFMNPNRIPVRIWRVDADLEHWSPVYRFEDPRIRHVHAIHQDPFMPERLWVTMGDFAGECFLGYSDDRFETIHFIGDGSQLWRVVGLLFKRDELAWLTDSHIEQNHIVTLARDSTEPKIHAERDASSWYAAETTDGLFLATTTVERGAGIQTDKARLLASRDAIEWTTVAEFKKDRYPMRGFGFGSLSLPAGQLNSAGFWLSGEGLIGLDGQSILCSIEWNR